MRLSHCWPGHASILAPFWARCAARKMGATHPDAAGLLPLHRQPFLRGMLVKLLKDELALHTCSRAE